MGALKVVGGLISLIMGALVFIVALTIITGENFLGLPRVDCWNWMLLGTPAMMWINLILSLMAIIGGFLAMAGKRAGGAIVLIVAFLWILGAIGPEINVPELLFLYPFSFFVCFSSLCNALLWIFSIENIILLFAGIMIIAGGED